nr:perisilin-2a-tau [Vazella pourtalesii]
MRGSFAIFLLNIFAIIQVYSILNPDEIINRINEVRRTAAPTGSDLRKVQWDNCLAKIASDYIETCPSDTKNPNLQQQAEDAGCVEPGTSVGESTFYSESIEGNFNSVEAINSWARLSQIYFYENNLCAGVCDDYKQLVQADMYRVGCAEIDESNCGGGGNRVICNFGTASDDARPYTAGAESCVDCIGEWGDACEDGLCVRSQQPTTTTGRETVTSRPTMSPTTTSHNHDHHHHDSHSHGSHDHKDRDDSRDDSHDHSHDHMMIHEMVHTIMITDRDDSRDDSHDHSHDHRD